MRSSRVVTVLAAAVGLAVAASGCGSGVSEGGGGDTIRVAVNELPAAKGNPFNSVGSPGIYTLAALYDPLTFADADGTVKPWLATEWTNTSPTTWTFTLRDGVEFSNGEPLDAAGVAEVINFLRTDDEAAKSAVAGDLSTIASAKAVDGKTVEITTSEPDPILPNQLAELYLPAPKVLTEQGLQAITDDPVGTGPFQVKNWGANKITLDAFTGSWRAPKAKALEIQALAEPASRMQALQSGQVDLITGLSPDQANQLSGTTRADITKANQVMSLAFITTAGDSPLSDRRVRQALNYAVDKQAIAKNLLLGQAEAVGQGITPEAAGHNPDLAPYPHDVAKARDLLAQAGYPDGFTFSADVVVGSFPADSEVYQLMKQHLADAGVTVELHQITFSDWLTKYLNNSWEVQAFGLSWNALPTMDGARAMSLFSCLKEPAFFCDRPAANVLSDAMTNLDGTSRTQQLQRVAKAMHDNPPALYLVRQIDINGLSASLQGFQNNNRFFTYDQMSKQ